MRGRVTQLRPVRRPPRTHTNDQDVGDRGRLLGLGGKSSPRNTASGPRNGHRRNSNRVETPRRPGNAATHAPTRAPPNPLRRRPALSTPAFGGAVALDSEAADRTGCYVFLSSGNLIVELVADGWPEAGAEDLTESVGPSCRGLNSHLPDGVPTAVTSPRAGRRVPPGHAPTGRTPHGKWMTTSSKAYGYRAWSCRDVHPAPSRPSHSSR